MAVATFSQIDEYGFERPTTFDYKTYEDFMSKYLRILARRSKRWEELKESEKTRRTNILKRFVRKGIPITRRPIVWMSISGGQQAREQSNYTYLQLKERISNASINETIEIDLPRTFPDNIYFTKENILPRQLFNILSTFAHQNNDVGYCQGLNYIAGLLILATKSEEYSFWLLKVLVENILPKYYIKSMSGLLTDLAVLDELVEINEPILHRHIKAIGMPWAVTTTKWFICIYSEVLPIETVLRIWDCIFYEGSKIIFRVALTLIKMHKAEILECKDLADIVTCFKSMAHNPKVIDCHYFMSRIFKLPGRLSNKQLEELRNKHALAK
ncbi:PREDICTED: growth hormone-regulated TBC protein 1-A [Nicrophorus vespilloides]|uniref:Growth hormone-regulated TBC protein 1-A n=1 Tax=Nicrophorus vespilloides TaxID=110193 RepID=A0ABM1MQH2_NICVS|nr:PREDICTED: growth hormone-regulated TBC protein 1-A [Nicrophorus vespilloides]